MLTVRLLFWETNKPSLAWPLEDALDVNVCPVDLSCLDCFLLIVLMQWVTESAFLAGGSTLDLFLTSYLVLSVSFV